MVLGKMVAATGMITILLLPAMGIIAGIILAMGRVTVTAQITVMARVTAMAMLMLQQLP
jgi:ABC-type transport system involved in multi-copper enzyme maturation permease subunit